MKNYIGPMILLLVTACLICIGIKGYSVWKSPHHPIVDTPLPSIPVWPSPDTAKDPTNLFGSLSTYWKNNIYPNQSFIVIMSYDDGRIADTMAYKKDRNSPWVLKNPSGTKIVLDEYFLGKGKDTVNWKRFAPTDFCIDSTNIKQCWIYYFSKPLAGTPMITIDNNGLLEINSKDTLTAIQALLKNMLYEQSGIK